MAPILLASRHVALARPCVSRHKVILTKKPLELQRDQALQAMLSG